MHAGGPYAAANGQVAIDIYPKIRPIDIVDTDFWEFDRNRRTWYPQRGIIEDTIKLDENGKNSYLVESFDSQIYYGQLISETAVSSDRGKHVAARASATYFGVDQFVGIERPDEFNKYRIGNRQEVQVNEPWPINVLVVSKDQEIISDKTVSVSVYERGERQYGQIDPYEWTEFFNCEIISQPQKASCEFTPTAETHYRIVAEITDSKGHSHLSYIEIEAIDDETRWLDKPEPKEVVEKELELTCDNKKVAVGDLVECSVQNHFDSTPVLVTVERAGVIDQWLVRLDNVDPVFEFEVLETYAPRFRLVVLSTAPKTPAGHVGSVYHGSFYQLAKVGFTIENPRLIPLSIKVAADRQTYSPRDSVKLTITSERNYGKSIPIEYAIAVIDEALLDLSDAGEDYYDPTQKIWDIDTDGVMIYGLVTRLMNISRKKTTSGSRSRMNDYSSGDSGGIRPSYMTPFEDVSQLSELDEKRAKSETRRVVRFLAHWEPSVLATGERTKLEFSLPDNLTSWKVMVLAVSADDRFGFASTTFGSIKDTEIRPVVPNVVTEGDKFHLGASIYNRTNRTRTLTVELQAKGLLSTEVENSYRERLQFAPQERKLVTFPFEAGFLPRDFQSYRRSGEITVVASAGDRRDKDVLEMRIPVRTSHFPVSSVVYGALDGDLTSVPFTIPEKLKDQNGELTFSLTTDEGVNLDGVFRYIRDYRYPCWEQRLTRALLAMQYLRIEDEGEQHGIQWSEAEEIIELVLDEAISYQAPNGGMVFFEPRDSNVSPYLSAYTLIAFAWLADAGYDVPQSIRDKLVNFLRTYMTWETNRIAWVPREERKWFGHFQATVSAVILQALAISNELAESELIEYSDRLEQMDCSDYLSICLRHWRWIRNYL